MGCYITDALQIMSNAKQGHKLKIEALYKMIGSEKSSENDSVKNNKQQQTETEGKVSQTLTSKEITENKFVPWVVDEWTPDDLNDAYHKLQVNNTACTIPESESFKHEFLARAKWDLFYKQNQANFFKDRHYIKHVFPEVLEALNNDSIVVAEVGCGVGNGIFPLVEHALQNLTKKCTFVVSDFSKTAIDLLKADNRYKSTQNDNNNSKVTINADVWDISSSPDCQVDVVTQQRIRNAVPWPCDAITRCNADITLLVFCLSAIHPDKMATAVRNVAQTLRANGGTLLFRDYGRYDEAQLKLAKGTNKRLCDNFYLKQNGTKCYYFTLEDVERLFVKEAQLTILDLHYIRRKYINRADGTIRRRVWVQGRFKRTS